MCSRIGTYCPTGSEQPLACPLGKYCETYGLSVATGDCTEGYFCNGSAKIPNPAPCEKGHYCPTGTTVQIACAPGTYSGMVYLVSFEAIFHKKKKFSNNFRNELSCFCLLVSGEIEFVLQSERIMVHSYAETFLNEINDCLYDFICCYKTKIFAFVDYVKKCCNLASINIIYIIIMQFCSTVYKIEVIMYYGFIFSIDREQNINETDCLPCTAGKYCQSYGLATPTGDCDAGYYCPGGQSTAKPTTYSCSPGHFCPTGSWNETGCPSGYYQPHWKQSTCDICPAGSYCKAFGE